jgi:GT2 family glycosyltransferase
MSNQYPKVNIIVLNYNGKNVLKKCLSDLFCLGYSNFEVVVVDNNSSDGSFERAKLNFPRATFIKNEQNLGFSAGNNVGIKYSLEKKADFVLLLNNDTELERNFLNKLVESALVNEAVGIFSPLIFSGDRKTIWFSGGEIDWLRMKTAHKKDLIRSDYALSDFISGCAMFVRAEVFAKIGLLDEDFFLYWEDVDFSVRAKRGGFSLLVVANSKIYHLEKSNESQDKKIYWLVLSGLIFFRKNSQGYLSFWILAYTFLRKMRNWNNLRKNKTKISLAVKQAYIDFKKFKCEK